MAQQPTSNQRRAFNPVPVKTNRESTDLISNLFTNFRTVYLDDDTRTENE